MRKGFAIFLLMVLLCPYLGTKAILLFRKMEVREAVKERILAGVAQSELAQLTFSLQDSQTELKWEHSKEFEFKGEMYDVVKAEPCGDSITYWCIHDRAETALNQQLEQLTAQETGKDPQHQQMLGIFLDFLKSLFFQQTTAKLPTVALLDVHFTYRFSTYPFYPSTDSPPPDQPFPHAG